MSEKSALPVTASKQELITRADGPIGWLRDEIDRLFDDFPFSRTVRRGLALPFVPISSKPTMEMIEIDGGYQLKFDLPGIDPKDVTLEVSDGVLVLSGERRAESETKEAGYLVNERSYGAFCRQAVLPSDADEKTIAAHLQDGVLHVDVKRSKDAEQRSRKIKIN